MAEITPAPTTTVIAQQPFSVDHHVAPPFDPLECLPPAAADRLGAGDRRHGAVAGVHRSA